MTSTDCQRRQQSPERGSLRAILLENSKSRLYTHPLEWTQDHLRHLSYRLHALSPRDKDSCEGAVNTLSSGWRKALGAIENIDHCRMKHNRDTNMRDLVEQLSLESGLKLKLGSVSIQYNNHAVAKIPLPAFYHERAAGHPVWAYLDDTWTSCHRHYFHEDRKRPDWYATAAIKNIRNSPIDPLHIAVLIALAQRSRKHGTDLPQRISLFVPKHSMPVIGSTNKQYNSGVRGYWDTALIQYTVVIPEGYLQKFDDPYHFHDCTLDIYQQPLPITQPMNIFRAIQKASGIPNPELCLKRKALGELLDAGHNRALKPKRIKYEEDKDIYVIVNDD